LFLFYLPVRGVYHETRNLNENLYTGQMPGKGVKIHDFDP